MSRDVIKNHITSDRTTDGTSSAYWAAVTENRIKLTRLDTSVVCRAVVWKPPGPCTLKRLACRQSRERGKLLSHPSKKNPAATPVSVQLPSSSGALVTASHGEGTAIWLDTSHLRDESPLDFSGSLNTCISFTGTHSLKESGKRLILSGTSSVRICFIYNHLIPCLSVTED